MAYAACRAGSSRNLIAVRDHVNCHSPTAKFTKASCIATSTDKGIKGTTGFNHAIVMEEYKCCSYVRFTGDWFTQDQMYFLTPSSSPL